MTIRAAELKDLSAIEEVHMECFPDSFSTILGGGMDYYKNFIKNI